VLVNFILMTEMANQIKSRGQKRISNIDQHNRSNIDNKSSLERFLKDHVTLKTGVIYY